MSLKGRNNMTILDILSYTTEADILRYYLGVTRIPIKISSPLRYDKTPSFSLFSPDGETIKYKDFSTNESGGLIELLSKIWSKDYGDTIEQIANDLRNFATNVNFKSIRTPINVKSMKDPNSQSKLECKIREWDNDDINYWGNYGITIDMLKYADVHPISHSIVIKDDNKYVFKADKYAYAYVERKENNITLKIYQPFNTKGHKWSSKHDASVISLWTKIPEKGDKLCICSSLKDALCLWANVGIPAIALQGEGYPVSETAANVLRERYKDIYILFDNDEAGLIDGKKLAEQTKFKNIVLPKNNYMCKDISDLRAIVGEKEFLKIILPLFE